MAIVWLCTMTAHQYAACGREIEVPRPNCPSCGRAMIFHGFYDRPLRVGVVDLMLSIRRARCRPCGDLTHALLPDFVAWARLDEFELVGAAVEQMAGGRSIASVKADSGGVPYSTVRSWRQRFAERAGLLARGFLAAVVALGDLVGLIPTDGEVAVALAAIKAAAAAVARRRSSDPGSHWRIANRIVGGQLLASNSNLSWSAA